MKLGPGRNKLGKQIAPGIWEDADGIPHFNIPDLLALFDLPNTSENRKIVKDMLVELMKKHSPNAPILYRKSTEDEGEDLR